MDDDVFTNVHFPHDAWAGGGLETRNWISEPWDDDEVKAYTENTFGKAIWQNPFNGNPDLENSIKAGLDYRYHDLPEAITANTFKQDWYEYIHIYQPPTQYSWGMGVMFHKTAGGAIWYMSVPLAPLAALPEPGMPVTTSSRGQNIGYFMDYPVLDGGVLRTTVVRWTNTGETRRYLGVHVIHSDANAHSKGQNYGYDYLNVTLSNYHTIPNHTVLFDVTVDHSVTPLWVKDVTFPAPGPNQVSQIYVIDPDSTVNQHYALSGYKGTHTLKRDLPEYMHVDEPGQPSIYY